MIKLRYYQDQALFEIRNRISEGKRKVLLVSPTGSGKTTIACALIEKARAKGNRAVFLAHRKELIEQCSGRLDQFGIDHGVIKSGHPRLNRDLPVQVASVDTLVNRKHFDAELVIIDEAHRSTANTYKKILERYENPVVCGLTATPFRSDGKPLGEIYEDIVELVPVRDLIEQGYLVEPTVFGTTKLDLSGVNITRGDFDKKELAGVVKNTIIHGELVVNWALHCGKILGAHTIFEDYVDEDGKKRQRVKHTNCDACTVVFAANVEQSKEIAEQFNNAGVKAAHLDGNTPDGERSKTLKALANREISVVSNFSLLNEGWDLPHLECVILSRPTTSKGLYKQMVGRLMRPDDDKRIAYLLDHANCTRMHGFVTDPETYSLTENEKRFRKKSKEVPIKECPKCKSVIAMFIKVCENCGFEFPRKGFEYTVEELEKLNDVVDINQDASEQQKFFNEVCLVCVQKEYKPNWARMQFQKRFGKWPTKQIGISLPKFFFIYERRIKKIMRAKGKREGTLK